MTPKRKQGRSREDDTFTEEIVRDILAQNELVRSADVAKDQGSPSVKAAQTTPEVEADVAASPRSSDDVPETARTPVSPRLETSPVAARSEQARVVSIPPSTSSRPGDFLAPTDAAAAAAYVPEITVAPATARPVERETVKLSDPRKMPTMRLPRKAKEEPVPEPVSVPAQSVSQTRFSTVQPSESGVWVFGVVVAGLLMALAVAIVIRLWPSSSPSMVEPKPLTTSQTIPTQTASGEAAGPHGTR